MKTIIKISTDYHSTLSHDEFLENIENIVNDGLDCFCEIKNDNLINVVEEKKNYFSAKEDYKNKTIVEAKGYSQGDWQTYTIYHNEKEGSNNLSMLVEELEKTFTHQNDYFVENFEQTEINGKKFNSEPHDYTSFCIRHIEFPEKEDVLKEYIEIYGEDYDECIIKID